MNRDEISTPDCGRDVGIQEPEPLHSHGFGLAELPALVTGFAAKHFGQLTPVRDVVSAPSNGIREALTFIVCDVITDQV